MIKGTSTQQLNQLLSQVDRDDPVPAMLREMQVTYNGSTIYIVRVTGSNAFTKPSGPSSIFPPEISSRITFTSKGMEFS